MCRGAIVEGNRVNNSFVGGPYQDYYNIREVVIRNNHYRNVGIGIYFLMGGLSTQQVTLTGLEYDTDYDGAGALATTQIQHDLVKGDRVRISGASPDPPYNGFFEVAYVGPDTQFQFKYAVPLTGDAPSAGVVQRVWGLDRFVVENNVIEGLLPGEWVIVGEYNELC
jgi:hypothetical protein